MFPWKFPRVKSSWLWIKHRNHSLVRNLRTISRGKFCPFTQIFPWATSALISFSPFVMIHFCQPPWFSFPHILQDYRWMKEIREDKNKLTEHTRLLPEEAFITKWYYFSFLNISWILLPVPTVADRIIITQRCWHPDPQSLDVCRMVRGD